LNKLALFTLAAAALFATAGGASAQIVYSEPGYAPRMEMRMERDDDRPRYNLRGYDDGGRHYRRNARIACPEHYTVQDGVCKPYRGY
jgi:hypothetical protein